jgi:hypothetical protein
VPTETIVGADSVVEASPKSLQAHNIRRATILSVVIPGAGQIYNRKWWKTPIIYAGLGTTIYLASLNQSEYRRYSNAFDQRRDLNNTEPDEFEGRLTERQLISNMRLHQSNRDLSLVFMVLLYGLNIIDANVDAHLFDFDISDDLSLKVEPRTWYNGGASQTGLTLTFSF